MVMVMALALVLGVVDWLVCGRFRFRRGGGTFVVCVSRRTRHTGGPVKGLGSAVHKGESQVEAAGIDRRKPGEYTSADIVRVT